MRKIILFTVAKSIGFYINVLSFIIPSKSLKLAYNLFSQPRKGRLSLEKLPKTLQNATLKTYQHDNHSIQTYTWNGNDEIIFLIHGWESNSSRWKKLLKHLTKTGKTIIAIDAPAHGLSNGKEFNVPTYAKFIDFVAQQFAPKTIIGHSVGGNATAYYIANYNHQVEKMILLGSPSDLKIIFNNFIKMLSLNNKVYNQIKQYSKERFSIDIEEFSAAKLIENISLEGIIAHDVQDDVVLIDEAKKLSKSWKKAKFIETNGYGHALHNDTLYQQISEFVKN